MGYVITANAPIPNMPTAPHLRRLLCSLLAMGVGAAAVLTGIRLVLVPVREDRAEARAYDAATTCVPGTGQERAGDCLSGVPAVLERVRTQGRNPTRVYIQVTGEDGTRREIRLGDHTDPAFAAPGTALRLVSWRGEVRHVNHGTGEAARTVLTGLNPRTAHETPLSWALGLIPGGAALAWGGIWFAWLSSYSGRRSPWQLWMPVGGLIVLASVMAGFAPMFGSVREALRWTGIATAVTVAVTAVACLRAVRAATDTVRVRPRRTDEERTFPAVLLGDTSGPAGTPRHTHIVAGPGVLAFTNDPSGGLRGTPLPPGLVLERVRHQYATDPGREVRGSKYELYHVAQCRDGDEEVLIAVERRHMPWLVGALTP